MKRVLLIATLLVVPTPSWAQCPAFPARGVQVIDAFLSDAANQPLVWGDDDKRRIFTKMVIEQLVWDFPSEGWTWKSADPGRPPSKDSISRIYGGRLCNWDWQNGATRERVVKAGDIGMDITGQTAIPVIGVNRMVSTPVPVPPVTPTPVPNPVDPVYGPREQMLEDRVVVRVGNLTAEIIATMNRMFGCRDDGKDQWGEPCATAQDNAQAIRGVAVKVDGVSAQVKAHAEKTNALLSFFSKPETITAVITTVLTAWLAPKLKGQQPAAQGAN